MPRRSRVGGTSRAVSARGGLRGWAGRYGLSAFFSAHRFSWAAAILFRVATLRGSLPEASETTAARGFLGGGACDPELRFHPMASVVLFLVSCSRLRLPK